MRVGVSVHDQLMGPADHLQVVVVDKFVRDVIAPAVPSAAGGGVEPFFAVVCGVRPQQIAERAVVGQISLAVDISDLVQILYLRGQPSVEAEDRAIDDCGQRQALEDLCEHLPDRIGVVFFMAFIVEAVQFVYFPVLVVASEDGDSAFVFDFEEQDVEEGFDRVEAPIDVVTHEEIVSVR